MQKFINKISTQFRSKIFKNSFWGVVGSLVNNVFLSLFYVLIIRHYSTEDMAQYVIAISLYQMIVAFSAMGLGQWFIREVVNYTDKNELVAKFLKMQAYFGFFFFLVNVVLVFLLYDNFNVRILSLLFAFNIIFDNIIYSIKYINIAEFAQKKTVTVLSIEAISKFAIACLLFIFPFSIIILAILLVVTRFITLNLFLRIGAAEGLKLMGFWKAEVSRSYVKEILYNYWPFAVIGSAYVIYWKTATLIISKMLPLTDVVHYQNSFKIFSLAQMLPIVVTSTMLPKLVEFYKKGNIPKMQATYKRIFSLCMLYGIGAFTFTYSFADELLPLIFGIRYEDTANYTKEMFFTMLVFPTSLLQANILIAMKLEKLDMWFNINSVIINTLLCLIGLQFIVSLSIVNYAIFISFIVFHISQDVVLLKRKVITIQHVIQFIGVSLVLVLSYIWLSNQIIDYILFPLFWIVVGMLYLLILIKIKKNDNEVI